MAINNAPSALKLTLFGLSLILLPASDMLATTPDLLRVTVTGGTSRRGYPPKITAINRSYLDVVQLIAKSGMNITPTAPAKRD